MGTPKPKGSPAWAARLLHATLQDTVDMLGDAAEAGVRKPATGHRAAVLAYMRQSPHAELLTGVYDSNRDTTERLLRASFDLVTSIIRIMESDHPTPVSALVLDRALGEATLRVCFIHDASVPPARTLVRMASYQLDTIEGNFRTAEAFGKDGAGDAESARENIAEMHALLTAGGYEIGPGRRLPLSAWLRLDGETESSAFNATDAYRRYIRVGSWQWAIGSGATHGLGWLLPNLVGTVSEEPMSSAADSLLTTLMSSIELADALARSAQGYTGADVDWFLKKIHQRRLGATAALGAPTGPSVHHRDYGSSRFRQATSTTGAIFRPH